MSRRQLPRTTAAILDAATFLPGEIAVDTTNDELRYDGDGSTVGGIKLAKKSDVEALDVRVDTLEAGGAAFADVASASTVDLGAVASDKVRITGSTGPITSFGTAAAGTRKLVRLASTPTLTYNATSLILPGDANIVGQADDEFEAVSLGSGNWYVGVYQRGAYPPATNTAVMNAVTSASSLSAGQIALGVREHLTANRTYYISASGSDANDGLSLLTPKLTHATLYNSVRDSIDTKGYTVKFRVLAGAYTQSFACYGKLEGVKDEAECVVEFDSGVSIATTGAPCLDAFGGAKVTFTGSSTALSASGSFAYGIRIWTDARALFGGFNFGACALYQAYIAEAYGRRSANCTFSDNAQIGVLVEVNGEYDEGVYTTTFSGSVTYSGHRGSAYLVAGEGSHVAIQTAVYSGSFTGRKYHISDLAEVVTINKLEDIPGSLEGVWTTPFVRAPEGRLTLTDGTPVTTSDVTAATTVHYEPYEGDYAPFSLNDANTYEMCTIGVSGLSLALDSNSGHTGYHQSGKNYDLFLYRRGSSGTFTLASGPAWTNDTTRASAISKPNGIWANTSAMTVRFGTSSGDTESLSAGEGVYVGTMRCTADGQTEDSLAKRMVWNAYNRRPRPMRVFDATNTWNYSTGTFQQANASTANQLEFVRGLNEDGVNASVLAYVQNNTSTARNIRIGIGLNSTTAIGAGCRPGYAAVGANITQMQSFYEGFPGLGRHFLAWLEFGDATGGDAQTWYGDAGAATLIQAGIAGTVAA